MTNVYVPMHVRPREVPERARGGAAVAVRVGLGWTAVAGSAAGLLALGLGAADAGPAGLRGALLAVFWLTAPGSALLSRLRLTAPTLVSQVPVVGLAVLVATSLTGTLAAVWEPRPVAVAVAVASLLAGAAGLVRDRGRLPRRPARRTPGRHAAPAAEDAPAGRSGWVRPVLLVGLVVAVELWVLALPGVTAAPPSPLGLFATGPVLLPVAVVLVLALLVASLRRGDHLTTGLSALALLLVLRATASATESVPIYAWTYKHLGVLGEIAANRGITPGTDIYMNWPAMFAAGAWFSQASGLSVLEQARWWPPVIQLLVALQVAALTRVLGTRWAGVGAAAALTVLLNWVGGDYFSPQAVALVLAGGVLVLAVQARRSRTAALLAIGLFTVMVPTHQLTPYWLLACLGALFVLRRVPWWVVGAMGVTAIGYLALHYTAAAGFGLFTGFDPLANAASNAPEINALGRRVGAVASRGTTVLMWGTTAVVLLVRAWRLGLRRTVRRGWRSRHIGVLAVISFSSFLLLGGQSYGGEAVLRVTLYSTLGCAAVLGPAGARLLARAHPSLAAAGARTAVLGRLGVVVACGWLLLCAALVAQATFGSWPLNTVQRADLQAVAWLSTPERVHATVVPVTPDWPGRATYAYRDFAFGVSNDLDVPLSTSQATRPDGSVVVSPPLHLTGAGGVQEDVEGRGLVPAYLVFTGTMRAHDAYYAAFADGSYQSLLDEVSASADWTLVRRSGDTYVFQLTEPGWPLT